MFAIHPFFFSSQCLREFFSQAVLLDYDTLSSQTLIQGGLLGLMAYKIESEGWRKLQLLKTYDEGTMPPPAVVEIKHLQMPQPHSSIDWYLSSLATCWAL